MATNHSEPPTADAGPETRDQPSAEPGIDHLTVVPVNAESDD